jgi:RNA polymerase sigma-70 factor (ECF subfamily)
MVVTSGAPAVIDSSTYDAIFRRSVDMIYRICLAVLHDADAADDATSAVLEKLVKRLPKSDVQDVDRWLRRVAKTTAIDHLRELRRHAPLEEAAEVPDPSPTPETLALDDDLRRLLKGHLSSLSPDQRRVVELRVAGLSAKEIAELLGRDPGWVDTTYFRALRKLRERLESDASGRGAP